MSVSRIPLTALALLVLAPLVLSAARPPASETEATPPAAEKGEKKEAESAPPHVVVSVAPFEVHVDLDGVFVSRKSEELSLAPRAWSPLTVHEAIPPGSRVEKGDVVLRLETESIDRAIADLEREVTSSKLALETAAHGIALLEKTLPLDLEAADRAAEIADRRMARFLKRGRELAEKGADMDLKSYANSLAYQREELKQLERMYREDDLTEETEEIVLTRQRNVVEQMEFSLETARETHRALREHDIEDRQRRFIDTARRESLKRDRTRAVLPIELRIKQMGLELQKIAHARSVEKLGRLREDRESFEVRAPRDGIVYYGQAVRGRWVSGGSLEGALRRGGMLQKHQVFMTIVDDEKLALSAAVGEAQLGLVEKGLEGHVVPTGHPGSAVRVSVKRVSRHPLPSGGFSADLEIAKGDLDEGIVPGLKGKIRLQVRSKKKAITVPDGALHRDDRNPAKRYVHVLAKEKTRRVEVKAGLSHGGRTEILEGLEAGQRVRLEGEK